MTRLSSVSAAELVHACAESNDAEAWEEFVHRFHRDIALSVIRTAYRWGQPPQQIVEDLVQETYLKLCADKCRLLMSFSVLHPDALAGYIKTIAVNVTHDHFKFLNSQKRGSGNAASSIEDVESEALAGHVCGEQAIEREILLKEIDRSLELCLEGPDQCRDRLIFWLYYQQGMSAKAIASLPTIGLTAKGVESVVLRLTRLVRQEIVVLRSKTFRGQKPNQKGLQSAESY